MIRSPTVAVSTEPSVAAAPAAPASVVVERITPLRALVFAHALWLVMLLITPVSPRWSSDWLPIAVLGMCLTSLGLGMALPYILDIRFRPVETGHQNLRIMLRLCLALGTIGLGFRVFDLLILRGVNLTLDIQDNRTASATGGASMVSTLAALLAPLAFASLLISWVAVRRGIARHVSPIAVVIGLVVVLLPVVLGSRSSLLLAVVQLGCLALLMLSKITSRMIGVAAAAGVGLMIVFALLFVVLP